MRRPKEAPAPSANPGGATATTTTVSSSRGTKCRRARSNCPMSSRRQRQGGRLVSPTQTTATRVARATVGAVPSGASTIARICRTATDSAGMTQARWRSQPSSGSRATGTVESVADGLAPGSGVMDGPYEHEPVHSSGARQGGLQHCLSTSHPGPGTLACP